MSDNEILAYFIKSNGHININKLVNIPKEIEEYLQARFVYYDNYKEVIKRIQYKIENRPVCPICGKPVKYIGKQKRMFTDTCGNNDCIIHLSNKQIKQAKLERHGDENYCNIEKIKQTKLERYGDENYCNSEKIKQTFLEKYGVSSALQLTLFKEKSKQTCLEKYGVEYTGQIHEKIIKTKQTKLERYGDENYVNHDKAKQTCLEKYGVEYVGQSEQVKEKIKNTCLKKYGCTNGGASKKALDKIKQTCLEKYGVDNFFKTDMFKISFHKKYNDIQQKINNTKRKNNSFNISKPEEKCYVLLKEKYSDIIRQYRDERYPFNCDFYIPSLDLFIEYQGSHYHQGHPFDENDDNDINTLNMLKEKANKSNRHKINKQSQYDNIIYTWTDLDVRKRNSAKENELNYIEFWDINEVKQWLKN